MSTAPSIIVGSTSNLRHEFSSAASAGELSIELVCKLITSETFFSRETDLWDFKLLVEDDAVSVAGIVKDIAAFHNTFGGFIFLGIKELEKDVKYQVVGLGEVKLNAQRLIALTKNYLDEQPSFGYSEAVLTFDSVDYCLGIISVPKRRNWIPVRAIRNGPDKGSRPIFRKDDFFLRLGDESLVATRNEHYQLILGPRVQFAVALTADAAPVHYGLIEHNLPDQAAIFARFIGRDGILSKLWGWLAEEFLYAKVLAGDGGKGKTSIAYEFAAQVVVARACGFEQVIWLTAKKRQFKAAGNSWIPLPQTHFESVEELLDELCSRLGHVDDNYRDASRAQKFRLIKEGLKTIPSLVVVDDVDSLEIDDQKKTLEIASLIGAQNSKFLFTTRANLTYSSEMAIPVPGMEIGEYGDFCKALRERHSVEIPEDVLPLHAATGGSPLLTESIVRLIKLGYKFKDALAEWKGAAGLDARKAALQKEIDRLSPEARRVLLAVSFLGGECSLSELKICVPLKGRVLDDAISELNSFFLLDAPKIIASEPRYSVGSVTRSLILGDPAGLASDFKSLQAAAKEMRVAGGGQGIAAGRRRTGNVIRQATALSRELKFKEALDTIKSELDLQPDNIDLLLTRGRILMEQQPKDYSEARKSFRRAFQLGQRKPMLFELWWEAEQAAKFGPGMSEVARNALQSEISPISEWHGRLAEAQATQGRLRLGGGDHASALDEFEAAADALVQAIRYAVPIRKSVFVRDSADLHDYIWMMVMRVEKNERTKFAYADRMIRRGDKRTVVFWHAFECFSRLVERLHVAGGRGGAVDVARDMEQRLRSMLDSAAGYIDKRPGFDDLLGKFSASCSKLSTLSG